MDGHLWVKDDLGKKLMDRAYRQALADTRAEYLESLGITTGEGILKAIEAYRVMFSRPTLVRIYVVDRPQWAGRLRQIVAAQQMERAGRESLLAPLPFAIPIVEFSTAALDPEKEIIALSDEGRSELVKLYDGSKIVWPWVCRVPGVWGEMSNGTWIRVKEGDGDE